MPSSESGSGDSEDSDYSNDGSSEEVIVFQKSAKTRELPRDTKERRAEALNMSRSISIQRTEIEEVNDDDSIDSEQERKNWERREYNRVQRELQELAVMEAELAENLKRKAKRLKTD